MKSTLLSATALVLFMAAPALAAPHDHGDHTDHGTPPAQTATPSAPGGHHDRGGGNGHQGNGGAGNNLPGGTTATGGHHHDRGTSDNSITGGATMGGTMGGRHHDRGTRNNPITGGGTMGGATMGGTAHGGTAVLPGSGRSGERTHAGRGHNSAFDALRRVLTSPRHFHHGSYHRPNGWYAHRWALGEFLPSLFFARDYWLDDYNDFDLPNPPPGTVWVRYGNDALLVDRYSGEVIEVDYNVFY